MKFDIYTFNSQVKRHMPLNEFGFTQSALNDSYIIYDSQWCRVKFYKESEMHDDHIHVYYGRLHAVNDSWTMIWQGKDHYCWYGHAETQDILKFLDGLTPQEAYNSSWGHQHENWRPYGLFQKSTAADQAGNDNVEGVLNTHANIWQTYQERFFEVFDLRHPEVWNRYIEFLRKIFMIENAEYKSKGKAHAPLRRFC